MRDNEYMFERLPLGVPESIPLDELMKNESIILDELKRAVDENYITQDEAEERMKAYHDGLTADTDNRDR